MLNESFSKIPERSLGQCRWCGAERVRLQYLMCPKCFRLANMIPSKAMVLLNQPGFKRKWGEHGITVNDLAPVLYQFLLSEESYFPSEVEDIIHWDRMQEEAAGGVTQLEIRDAADAMLADPTLSEVPTREELTQLIGMKRTLRFIMLVAVARGIMKIKTGSEDEGFINEITQECGDHTFEDIPSVDPTEKSIDDPKSEKKGMYSKDILSRMLKR